MPLDPLQDTPTPGTPGSEQWWGPQNPDGKQVEGKFGPSDSPAASQSNGGFPVAAQEPSVSDREMAIDSVISHKKYGMETLVPESLKEYRDAMDKVIEYKKIIAAKPEYKEMLKGGIIITSELRPEGFQRACRKSRNQRAAPDPCLSGQTQ